MEDAIEHISIMEIQFGLSKILKIWKEEALLMKQQLINMSFTNFGGPDMLISFNYANNEEIERRNFGLT